MDRAQTIKRAYLAVALSFLTCITALIYWPGLNGPFLLDDFSNLDGLEKLGSAPDLNNYLFFILEGVTGSLGRPLSLITFAFQAGQWPDPWAFKLVNLIIHIINGIVLFFLIRLLLNLAGISQSRRDILALVATFIWLLHPLQVSTVLYVIQRMTELSGTFILLGLLIYLKGRKLSLQAEPKYAYIWMTTGIIFGTLFATLCKENGALLPLFIVITEATILSNKIPRLKHKWKTVFIYLPSIALIFYVLFHIPNYIEQHQFRNFTLSERLLTEMHVLLDYLKKTFILSPSNYSLFHDDFPVSKGLLSPPITLAGLFVLSIIFIGSILYRKRYPLVAFSGLFFIVGHSLEAGPIPLELYFEHRNYLPIIGPILATVVIINTASKKLRSRYGQVSLVLMLVITLSGITFSTLHQAKIWGEILSPSLVWAIERPLSMRAQSNSAAILARLGRYNDAAEHYDRMLTIDPLDSTPYILRTHLACFSKEVKLPEMETLIESLRKARLNLATIATLNAIVLYKEKGDCRRVTHENLALIFEALLKNHQYLPRQADIYQIYAMQESNEQHYLKAIQLAQESLAKKEDIRVALHQLRWLYLAGQEESAYKYLSHIQKLSNNNWRKRLIWQTTIDEWRIFLEKELKTTRQD